MCRALRESFRLALESRSDESRFLASNFQSWFSKARLRELRVAAKIDGTALPWATGNIGVAAHRDTFFRRLLEVKPQDGIVMTTSYGTFRHVVNTNRDR
jgi:hypothetical protein